MDEPAVSPIDGEVAQGVGMRVEAVQVEHPVAREFLHVEAVPAPLVPELPKGAPGTPAAAARIRRGDAQVRLGKDEARLSGQPTHHPFDRFPVEGAQGTGGRIVPAEALQDRSHHFVNFYSSP